MSDIQTEVQAWVTLRGILRYLRRVKPTAQACEEEGDYGPCWRPGWATLAESGDVCPICLERYDTVAAQHIVSRLLYATNRRLERAAPHDYTALAQIAQSGNESSALRPAQSQRKGVAKES